MLTWADPKDPAEVLDYYFDWTDTLEPAIEGSSLPAEHIVSCTALVTVGATTIQSQALHGNVLQVWLTGGTANSSTLVQATMVTSQGRTYTQTARLLVGVQ